MAPVSDTYYRRRSPATFLLTDRKKLGYNYTCVVGDSDVTQSRGVAQLG